jgi:hypothetical protein
MITKLSWDSLRGDDSFLRYMCKLIKRWLLYLNCESFSWMPKFVIFLNAVSTISFKCSEIKSNYSFIVTSVRIGLFCSFFISKS